MNKEKKLPLPVLVDDNFNIKVKFDSYKNVLRILRDLNYNLTFANSNGKLIHVHDLVGVDVMQFTKRSAWMFPCSIAPFENSPRFLHENQIKPVGRKSVEPLENNYPTITSNYSHSPTSRENFKLNPKKSYSDTIGELFDESLVERNLEKKFDVDNLGSYLNEHKSVSDYDKTKIKEFENSIPNRNNAYYVDLPWHKNVI